MGARAPESRDPHDLEASPDEALRADVDALAGEWLTLPEAAEELGVGITEIRSMLSDNVMVAIRRGHPAVLSVPAALIRPEPLASFPGTWTVLQDAGFGDLEALRWLFTEGEGPAPITLLRAGRKREVRRQAQALAL